MLNSPSYSHTVLPTHELSFLLKCSPSNSRIVLHIHNQPFLLTNSHPYSRIILPLSFQLTFSPSCVVINVLIHKSIFDWNLNLPMCNSHRTSHKAPLTMAHQTQTVINSKSRRKDSWHHTYVDLCVNDVNDTSKNNDEVKDIPSITKVILQRTIGRLLCINYCRLCHWFST